MNGSPRRHQQHEKVAKQYLKTLYPQMQTGQFTKWSPQQYYNERSSFLASGHPYGVAHFQWFMQVIWSATQLLSVAVPNPLSATRRQDNTENIRWAHTFLHTRGLLIKKTNGARCWTWSLISNRLLLTKKAFIMDEAFLLFLFNDLQILLASQGKQRKINAQP